jgi:hypothetical protein
MTKATLKYHIGQLVRNPTTHPGQTGEIVEINKNKRCPYRVKFLGRPAIWHPENELTLAQSDDNHSRRSV